MGDLNGVSLTSVVLSAKTATEYVFTVPQGAEDVSVTIVDKNGNGQFDAGEIARHDLDNSIWSQDHDKLQGLVSQFNQHMAEFNEQLPSVEAQITKGLPKARKKIELLGTLGHDPRKKSAYIDPTFLNCTYDKLIADRIYSKVDNVNVSIRRNDMSFFMSHANNGSEYAEKVLSQFDFVCATFKE